MPSVRFNKPFFIHFTAVLFVFLFVYAAVSKLVVFRRFEVELGQSPMLTRLASVAAWLIPCLEILLAVMLTVPRLRIAGLYASYSLMVMFSAYIVAIRYFSEFIPCSCGGILQNMNWNQHLVFNLFFVCMAMVSILFSSPDNSLISKPGKNRVKNILLQ